MIEEEGEYYFIYLLKGQLTSNETSGSVSTLFSKEGSEFKKKSCALYY